MASGPNSPKRLIKKKTRAASRAGRSRKERASAQGSFEMKARRDRIATTGKETGSGTRVAAQLPKGLLGGALFIIGKMSADVRKEVLATIARFGRQQRGELMVRPIDGRIVVMGADSHTIVALGKALHQAHKGGTLSIEWKGDTGAASVRWMAGGESSKKVGAKKRRK